jgi:CHASE3 domain sensor protein
MGFLIAFLSMVVVFGLLLPILAMMYFDILETKQETKRQQEVMQRLINKTKEEDERRENTSNGKQKPID